MKKIERSPKEKMLLALSFGTAFGIFPFAIYRFLQQDYAVAALDLLIVIFMIFLGFFVYKTRNLKVASIILVFLAIGGNIFSFYLKGVSQIYWMFPAMLSSYYVLGPKSAAGINTFLMLLYVPGLVVETNNVSLSTIIVTLLVTNLIAFVFSNSLHKQQKQLKDLAHRDYLTQTGNRRKLDEDLELIFNKIEKSGSKISMILIDLDRFKDVNDTFGHILGDQVLHDVAQILIKHATAERVYRYGGEEFMIICEKRNQQQCYELAEQIRKAVEAADILDDRKVTISLGVSEYQTGGVKSWIEKVDQALYQSKNGGRNKTTIN